MHKLFGTDGIRGLSNEFPIDVESIVKISTIVGHLMKSKNSTKRVLIGKDTRLSSYMIENAISAGLLAAGMDVFLAGPIPTPGVSFLTRSMRCEFGIMISASHNAYPDNGIKFFDHKGEKFSNEMQKKIEKIFYEKKTSEFYCKPDEIGKAYRVHDVIGRYVEFVKKTFPQDENLSGIKVVIDAANGAAYKIASEILWELGAEVVPIGIEPNGKNINLQCGSTNLKLLQQTVIQTNSDIGIALDGDADRIAIVDDLGKIIDGDQIIALLAKNLHDKKKLNKNTVVTTIMSNYGLEKYLKSLKIKIIRTDVGDKNVYEEINKNDYSIGGEKSGHIIMKKYSTTGDGLMVAVQVLAILKKLNTKSNELLNIFKEIPQTNINLKMSNKPKIEISEKLDSIKRFYEKKIDGRIVIRQSGTEPMIRLMIESEKDESRIVPKIIESIRKYLAKNDVKIV